MKLLSIIFVLGLIFVAQSLSVSQTIKVKNENEISDVYKQLNSFVKRYVSDVSKGKLVKITEFSNKSSFAFEYSTNPYGKVVKYITISV
mgnify:FL=1